MSGHSSDRSYSSVVRRSKRGFSMDAIVAVMRAPSALSDQIEALTTIALVLRGTGGFASEQSAKDWPSL